MKHLWSIPLCLLFVLAACASQPTAAPTATAIPATAVPPTAVPPTAVPTPASPFDYNAKVPFDTKIISQTEQEGATVTELSYAAHDPSFASLFGGRIVATVVSPKGNGPFAGIVHMFGDFCFTPPAGSQAYLGEALTMASHGAVTLILKNYFPSSVNTSGTESDRPLIIGQVIELRRALDFLLSQPGVDPQRVGYVLQDYGGSYGGVLAGVDKRAKTYVLIDGYPSFSDALCGEGCPPDSSYDTILPYVKDIDPINFIPNAAPASLFFQLAKNNQRGLTEDMANQYTTAASQPKKIEWYDDSYLMSTDAVLKARQAWLIDQLKLTP